MKVALFVHQFFPDGVHGTETYTLELARGLAGLGHEPAVVTARAGSPERRDYEGIPVFAGRGAPRELLQRMKPDVVHVTHLLGHADSLPDALEGLRLPAVATLTDFHGLCRRLTLQAADGSLCYGPDPARTNCLVCAYKSAVYGARPEFLRRKLGSHFLAEACSRLAAGAVRIPGLGARGPGKRVREIIDRPDALMRRYNGFRAAVAPTRFIREAYAAHGLSIPIRGIRYGASLARLPKPARPPGSPIRFGFIGQIASHKGPHVLLEAFARLPRDAAELHLFGMLCDHGAYQAGLERRAAGRAVSFHGPYLRPEGIRDALARLDFLVIPSLWHENAPLVLMNALASGTPVIASDVAGMAEFIEPGKNGWLFARGDSADLERVLRGILENPERALGVSQTTRYPRTIREMASDTAALYEEVLAAPRSASWMAGAAA